ncbi:hypothetical protein [Leptotrichia alba]|uniref:Uncharacterized protein n=1 Tax=Leptotrichia alba TaxID=3239304 RepID=A0AB39V6W9_9FUSO
MNLKTDDIANSGDITAIGKVSGGNIDNSESCLPMIQLMPRI